MGAYFSDVSTPTCGRGIAQSVAIEEQGIGAYADANDLSLEACFETLMTDRIHKAVAG